MHDFGMLRTGRFFICKFLERRKRSLYALNRFVDTKNQN